MVLINKFLNLEKIDAVYEGMKTGEKREKKVLMLKSCAAIPSKTKQPRK